jgi:predicted P-loop ATPase
MNQEYEEAIYDHPMDYYADPVEVPQSTTPYFPDLNERGKPLNTSRNLTALLNSCGLKLAINRMTMEIELFEHGKLLNISFEAKRSKMIDACSMHGFQKSVLDDHLTAIAEQNSYHPLEAHLEGGVWDGESRIKPLIAAMNAKHPEVAEFVMTKFFVSVIASVYQYNFSTKLVPIIQGDQSFRKTAFIKRFASMLDGAFLEGHEVNPDNKDSVISCIKSLIVEMGEFERTSKNSQGSLKAFLTREVDTVRPPYGRVDIKKPRATNFIGTVNGSEFLRDDTGSSRYAVIELEKRIDMDAANELLGWEYNNGRLTLRFPERLRQFWLEVLWLFNNGATWHLTDAELEQVAVLNKQHDAKTSFYDILNDKFVDVDMSTRHNEWMTATQVCEYCEISKTNVRQVGKALKQLANDELIESKSGRANKTLYDLPTVTPFSS